jgi:hypothetical protein
MPSFSLDTSMLITCKREPEEKGLGTVKEEKERDELKPRQVVRAPLWLHK